MTDSVVTAAASGVFALGRNVAVTRLGFGAMRITGPGVWGDPPERHAAVLLLRRAVDLGVDFIDTADSYGPFVSEELIREALHPYREVTVATKGGLLHTGPGRWEPDGRPEHLRRSAEMSLRRLGLDTIELYQLHAIDPQVPAADQLGALDELRREGKIRHIGLCGVSTEEISEARLTAPVACVQNPYHLADRRHEPVLDYCEREGIGFVPCSPLALTGAGRRAHWAGPLARLAAATGTSTFQLALAWLLRRSPVMLPVPGTSSAAHLEENVAAAELELTDEEFGALSALARPGQD
jgi:aryl-alcohol dehydrogenase-like predicted oxidoreductase